MCKLTRKWRKSTERKPTLGQPWGKRDRSRGAIRVGMKMRKKAWVPDFPGPVSVRFSSSISSSPRHLLSLANTVTFSMMMMIGRGQ